MSPFQVLSVIACCAAVFVGVLAFLSSQGIPLPLAVLSVYLFAVVCMLGMQRRARESCEDREGREDIERGWRRRGDPSRLGSEGGDVDVRDDERKLGYAATGLRESFRSGA